jgi:hypothetical protein
MPQADHFLTIRQAARFFGVAGHTPENWEAAGAIPVHRNPKNNYRLLAVAHLEQILTEITRPGTCLTGWQRLAAAAAMTRGGIVGAVFGPRDNWQR